MFAVYEGREKATGRLFYSRQWVPTAWEGLTVAELVEKMNETIGTSYTVFVDAVIVNL